MVHDQGRLDGALVLAPLAAEDAVLPRDGERKIAERHADRRVAKRVVVGLDPPGPQPTVVGGKHDEEQNNDEHGVQARVAVRPPEAVAQGGQATMRLLGTAPQQPFADVSPPNRVQEPERHRRNGVDRYERPRVARRNVGGVHEWRSARARARCNSFGESTFRKYLHLHRPKLQ
eukprot:scaffold46778_cov57-Phaeocystis_antarctica.AAC.2